MQMSAVIEVRDVSFRYGQHTVLENISFSVKEGEYLGIIGPNGGGKTTLIKIMIGLLHPLTGNVRIFGEDIRRFNARHQIGYVPQRAAHEEMYFPVSVEEIVWSGRTAHIGIFRTRKREDHMAVREAMKIADVLGFKDRPIGELSGGERQKVFIARALATRPKILILDEPVVGVDVVSKDRFYSFIKHLNVDHGITIILVSHDLGAIANEVTDILCLNKSLICHGPPQEFIKEEFIQQIYGKEVKSIFHDH
jgi:zinc transport system ATP-binding protein